MRFLVLVVELLGLSIAESRRERSVMLNESWLCLWWRLIWDSLGQPRRAARLRGRLLMHCCRDPL
jgi:hypothetical protein